MKKKEEENSAPLTQKGEPRKSNGGRKSIFKNDEAGKMFWLSLPETHYEELSVEMHKLREPYLKNDNEI